MESICECKFNLLKNELMEGNALLDNTVGEISKLIGNSNLDVLKCFRNVFKLENILKSVGGFIIIGIILFEIIFAFKFILYDFNNIMRYLYNLTNNYIDFIIKDVSSKNILIKSNNIIYSPPKKNGKNINNKDNKINYHKNSISLKSKKKLNLQNSKNYLKRRNKISSKTVLLNNKDKSIKKSTNKLNTKNNDNKYMEEYLKEDLDELDYDNAIKNDKRSFCEFYKDRIKVKQMIINTFVIKIV